jgi:hypothetical protein
MFNNSSITSNGWLAFELNVLRRLKFKSAALPLTGETNLGTQLKRWNMRVLANDLTHFSWTKAVAEIQNNSEKLVEVDVNTILNDAYVPHHHLQNSALRKWFSETDAWWFDNVRRNIEKLGENSTKSIALSIGMKVGDYVLSFDDETLELRQPLSNIYKRLCSVQPAPYDNGQINICTKKSVNDFIAENYTDLMFLRLPRTHQTNFRESLGLNAWREEWIRGGDDFWSEDEKAQTGKLGSHVETKFQYLRHIEEIFKTASHIPTWAIAHIEDGFISTQDIVEVISHIRRVDTIYTKDFSELTGMKAVVITA